MVINHILNGMILQVSNLSQFNALLLRPKEGDSAQKHGWGVIVFINIINNMGVEPKIGGPKPLKMDGENNGSKPYQNG